MFCFGSIRLFDRQRKKEAQRGNMSLCAFFLLLAMAGGVFGGKKKKLKNPSLMLFPDFSSSPFSLGPL